MHYTIVIRVWLRTEDELRNLVTRLMQEYSGSFGELAVNNAVVKPWDCDRIIVVFMQDLDLEDTEDVDSDAEGHDEL